MVSSVVASAPWGPVQDQPWFLNMVVGIRTSMSPDACLSRIQEIEADAGRDRSGPGVVRYGPRPLDVDLLLYGNAVVEDAPRLVVPHPEMAGRRFVMVPMAEVAPDLVHPTQNMTMLQLMERCADDAQVVTCGPLDGLTEDAIPKTGL